MKKDLDEYWFKYTPLTEIPASCLSVKQILKLNKQLYRENRSLRNVFSKYGNCQDIEVEYALRIRELQNALRNANMRILEHELKEKQYA